MADSIPAVKVTPTWLDVTTLTGITAGTSITIQNLGRFEIMVAVSTTTPDANEIYEVIQPKFFNNSVAAIPSGNSQVWVKGDGYASIQEV